MASQEGLEERVSRREGVSRWKREGRETEERERERDIYIYIDMESERDRHLKGKGRWRHRLIVRERDGEIKRGLERVGRMGMRGR